MGEDEGRDDVEADAEWLLGEDACVEEEEGEFGEGDGEAVENLVCEASCR